jgi:hypothetical protein
MIPRFAVFDDLTPIGGTTISEWTRQADLRSDGTSVHEVRNILAVLIGIRYEASSRWTRSLQEKDSLCEAKLRRLLMGIRDRSFGVYEPEAVFG